MISQLLLLVRFLRLECAGSQSIAQDNWCFRDFYNFFYSVFSFLAHPGELDRWRLSRPVFISLDAGRFPMFGGNAFDSMCLASRLCKPLSKIAHSLQSPGDVMFASVFFCSIKRYSVFISASGVIGRSRSSLNRRRSAFSKRRWLPESESVSEWFPR